jgi:hypothetical protein
VRQGPDEALARGQNVDRLAIHRVLVRSVGVDDLPPVSLEPLDQIGEE